MKRNAYILVFDGLADWEAAHALCEINKSDKFDVLTVGFSDEAVTTMGGFRVLFVFEKLTNSPFINYKEN